MGRFIGHTGSRDKTKFTKFFSKASNFDKTLVSPSIFVSPRLDIGPGLHLQVKKEPNLLRTKI
jgi:hypothetical protein